MKQAETKLKPLDLAYIELLKHGEIQAAMLIELQKAAPKKKSSFNYLRNVLEDCYLELVPDGFNVIKSDGAIYKKHERSAKHDSDHNQRELIIILFNEYILPHIKWD